jgi:hypothetical protein
VSNRTSTRADPCAAHLVHLEEDKAVYADKERKADREGQEQAADRRLIVTIMASLGKTVLMVFHKTDSADLMDARALLHAAEPLRIGNGSHQGARHFHR